MTKLLELLAVSSIWISIAAACFPPLVCIVYDYPFHIVYSIIAFLCAFFVYSWDKVSGSKEDLLSTPERAILANYPIRQLAILAYCLAILLAIAADWTKLPNVLAFGLAGWIYTVRIFGRRPKDIPVLKSLIVAGAWSYTFAGLPGVGYGLVLVLFFINTVMFDVRDIAGDRVSGVRTIPVILGHSRTVGYLAVLNCVLAAIHPISAAYGFLILWHFRKPRSNLAYDVWIDGWSIISLILTYGLSIAFIY